MMIGLPNETIDDIFQTVEVINENCTGIKIHSTYIQCKTELEKMFHRGEYIPITQDYYVDTVAKIISHLNNQIVIHRINADPPKDKLIAPNWTLKKKVVLNAINKRLEKLDIYQGDKKLFK